MIGCLDPQRCFALAVSGLSVSEAMKKAPLFRGARCRDQMRSEGSFVDQSDVRRGIVGGDAFTLLQLLLVLQTQLLVVQPRTVGPVAAPTLVGVKVSELEMVFTRALAFSQEPLAVLDKLCLQGLDLSLKTGSSRQSLIALGDLAGGGAALAGGGGGGVGSHEIVLITAWMEVKDTHSVGCESPRRASLRVSKVRPRG